MGAKPFRIPKPLPPPPTVEETADEFGVPMTVVMRALRLIDQPAPRRRKAGAPRSGKPVKLSARAKRRQR